jgi:hypothetical protein
MKSDSIRYFFAADRDQAGALWPAARSGSARRGAPDLDLMRDDPQPEHGQLELWIGAERHFDRRGQRATISWPTSRSPPRVTRRSTPQSMWP